MPCYDPHTMEVDGLEDDNYKLRLEMATLREKLNERTEMLCGVLAQLETLYPANYKALHPDIKAWHESHKQFDEKRK